jgi:pyridoxamine 5'-phosphate oxidase
VGTQMGDASDIGRAVAALRLDYRSSALNEGDVDADPIVQFTRWFEQSLAAGIGEVNAMTVATATRDGAPSARIVLLKGFDARGFVFYTNYEGRKGRELAENPRAALVFHWVELHRQVRVTGTVEKVTAEESNAYFQSRPRGSRLGAWASRQSTVLAGREELEARLAELIEEYGDEAEIPLPSFWGGYRVIPETVEFWQGRTSRLHDRLCYTRQVGDAWRIERLSP